MKAYRFSLATVMRIRQLEERLAREALLLAQRELRASQEGYRGAHRALAEYAAPTAPTSVDDLRWRYDQSARLAEAVNVRREELLLVASRRDEAVASWKGASQRAEVLSRLNADAWARWRATAQREEISEMDNLTSARHSWSAESS